MIPFWKKTGKHSKPQSAQKRRQNAKPAVPQTCLLYTSPSPRDVEESRMPSSA